MILEFWFIVTADFLGRRPGGLPLSAFDFELMCQCDLGPPTIAAPPPILGSKADTDKSPNETADLQTSIFGSNQDLEGGFTAGLG